MCLGGRVRHEKYINPLTCEVVVPSLLSSFFCSFGRTRRHLRSDIQKRKQEKIKINVMLCGVLC